MKKDEHRTKTDLIGEMKVLRGEVTRLREAEAGIRDTGDLYRSLADSSPVGVYFLVKGKFRFINTQFERSTGYRATELIGQDSLAIVYPEDRDQVRRAALEMLRGKRTNPYEFRAVKKDGSIRWILGTVAPLSFKGERAIHGSYMDITEQKETRRKLEEMETLEASILDALPVAVIVLRERRIHFANRAVETVFGWKADELVGRGTRILYRSDDEYEQIGRHFYPVLEKQRTFSEEFPCRHRDGHDILCFVSTSRIGATLQEKGIVATYEDITVRKNAEAALRESEQHLHSIIDGSSIATFVIGRDHRVICWNRALEELSGIRAADMIGSDGQWRAFYPEKRPCMADLLVDQAFESISAWYSTRYSPSKLIEEAYEATDFFPALGDGGKWLRFTAAAIRDSAGILVGAVETLEDISEQKSAEEALKESEERLRAILEGSPTPTFVIDRSHRVIGWNKALEELTGVQSEDVIDTDGHSKILYRDKRPTVADLLVNGAANLTAEIRKWYGGHYRRSELLQEAYEATGPFSFPGKESRWLHFTAAAIRDGRGELIGAIETMTDVSPLKRAEEELKLTVEKLRKTMAGIIRAIDVIVETRDPYTAGHQHQVARLAEAISKEMGLPAETIEAIYVAASIHDLGKIYVPAEILSKPGRISDIEKAIIRTHSQVGYDILKSIDFPWPIAEIVLQHHERLDGSGYPRGLKDGDIRIEARILGLADVVESMGSHRPYRPTLGMEKALDEIRQNRGSLYDPDVVDTCLALFRDKGFHFEDTMGDGAS
jgi:PAS domain S-box-containing protein/putative nucleotidyltransferase with HDIG domain